MAPVTPNRIKFGKHREWARQIRMTLLVFLSDTPKMNRISKFGTV